MMLGEVSPGGTGSGLYGMLLFALAVGVHRRADGRANAGVPRQEDPGAGDEARRALHPRSCRSLILAFTGDLGRARHGDCARSSTPARTASPRSSTRSRRRRTTTARRSAASPATPTGSTRRCGLAMLGRPLPADDPGARDRRLARAASSRRRPRPARSRPEHAAVRRAARRRRGDRRRPHLLPRPRARPDRRAAAASEERRHTARRRRPTTRARRRSARGRESLFDPRSCAARSATVRKLDPRQMARNPVMFVVEIGSVLTTVLFFRKLRRRPPPTASSPASSRSGCGSRCCSRTSPRRWPKAAARRRPTRCARRARRRSRAGPPCRTATLEEVPELELAGRRRVRRRRRRADPRRRRGHRGHRVGRRVGDHRRVGAGDPRVGRRPLGGDRRHARALRPDRRARSRRSRARRSSTA